jgi:hypothetical protein
VKFDRDHYDKIAYGVFESVRREEPRFAKAECVRYPILRILSTDEYRVAVHNGVPGPAMKIGLSTISGPAFHRALAANDFQKAYGMIFDAFRFALNQLFPMQWRFRIGRKAKLKRVA